ncbi:MAG: hypothetical protein GY820_27585, partial [Gammaproteobacteria bacterium]|nr:hypothetical protein [Gammaproteobacteria bacterium]
QQNYGGQRQQNGGNYNSGGGRGFNSNPPASNSNFRNQNYQQQQQQQPQQNRQSGYVNRPMQGGRAPYTNSGIRMLNPQQEVCTVNTPENGFWNDPDPDQCEIGGQYQYGPNDSADENYFENNERQHIGGYVEYPNDVNNSQQVSPEHLYSANQGENVPIYSQVPFQPEQSEIKDMLHQLSTQMASVDQKVTGVDQRVAKIEQKRSQSSSPNFRLSYAEGNTPMKEGTKLNSTLNQSLAKGVQGTHSAVSDLVENKQ